LRENHGVSLHAAPVGTRHKPPSVSEHHRAGPYGASPAAMRRCAGTTAPPERSSPSDAGANARAVAVQGCVEPGTSRPLWAPRHPAQPPASRPFLFLWHKVLLPAPPAPLLIRLMAGGVFLWEGVMKFVFPHTLGVGRFLKLGIPAPEVMAPLVGV